MRKSALATLAACAAVLAALTIPALASAATSPTTVTITFVDRPGPDIFRGRVSSPNENCRGERTVNLYRVRPARDQRIDTDVSEDTGRWDIDVEGDPAPGDYYVRVTRRVLSVGNACAAAVSPTIAVAG